ncbi:MAG: YibE/F family protein [Clostridium sp.]|nr:YibE/F family protein [Clostridium sp.]MCI1714888.1 YibE/F family protein [Clostridium sp.]MCI1798923.1 YibE/F family protein [Clostridium sp.]MCI1813071.1 YibE/F family protein [Clostridium sp.]MCI2201334.1 YibE/F family protein [Clostridium sp.]
MVKKLHKYIFMAVFILIFIACPIFAEADGISSTENTSSENSNLVRARIIQSSVKNKGGMDAGDKTLVVKEQILKINIIEGKHSGEKLDVTHDMQPSKPDNIEYKVGDEVFLSISEGADGSINSASVYQVVRDKPLSHLLFLFIFSMVLIGGFKGVKSLVSLGITCLIILKVFLPSILQGHNPITLSISICIVITIINLVIVSGFNKKTTAAILGTSGGVIISGIIAFMSINSARVLGVGTGDAQLLMDTPLKNPLNFKAILFGSILIGTLGAVMDVSMSIASTMKELRENNPGMPRGKIVKAGMSVGRDIMGTMATTLILAYISGAICLVLGYMANNSTFVDIVNQDMIACDIIKTFASSIGLIFTIPITAFIYLILDC